MPTTREYREIAVSSTDFSRMLTKITGSDTITLAWTDYSEGYWISEMKTSGYTQGLAKVRITSKSSRGIPYSETLFDCGDEASPREVQGGSTFMDRLRVHLGRDVVPETSFILEAVLKGDDEKSFLYLFVRESSAPSIEIPTHSNDPDPSV